MHPGHCGLRVGACHPVPFTYRAEVDQGNSWKLPTSARAGRIIGYYLVNFLSSALLQCIGLGTSNVARHTKKAVYAAGTFVSYSLGNIIGPLLFDA